MFSIFFSIILNIEPLEQRMTLLYMLAKTPKCLSTSEFMLTGNYCSLTEKIQQNQHLPHAKWELIWLVKLGSHQTFLQQSMTCLLLLLLRRSHCGAWKV